MNLQFFGGRGSSSGKGSAGASPVIEPLNENSHVRTTTRPEIYYTIAGYWKKMGHILTTNEAAALGKKASNICRALGCVKRKVDDEKYGTVGSYPIHILKTVYENWLCEPTTF